MKSTPAVGYFLSLAVIALVISVITAIKEVRRGSMIRVDGSPGAAKATFSDIFSEPDLVRVAATAGACLLASGWIFSRSAPVGDLLLPYALIVLICRNTATLIRMKKGNPGEASVALSAVLSVAAGLAVG